MAAIYSAFPICPLIATLKSPRIGTVMLVIIEGIASLRISLCESDSFNRDYASDFLALIESMMR